MLKFNYRIVTISFFFCFICNCSCATVNNRYKVDKVIDLQGDTLNLPENSILCFEGDGEISNGTINGNKTQIEGCRIGIFRDVDIAGTWNVPMITSDMFYNANKINCIKELFDLASPHLHNTIILSPGEYKVSIDEEWGTALSVVSNTDLIINGIITLMPNRNKGYQIVNVSGNNIKVYGRGTIVGDKDTHLAEDGEWGMGINISSGNNINISDIDIKKCWGDCIYVGRNSNNVEINNCRLDHGRRQGISITSGDNIVVKNCIITNVSGTSPEYGIDIEPNINEVVGSVFIKNVAVYNCGGGFASWCGAKNSRIGYIEIENCTVEGVPDKRAYDWYKSTPVKIKNCLYSGNIVR